MALLLAAGAVRAQDQQDAEQRGLAIAREIDRRDQGWETMAVDLTMVLRSRNGQESRRLVSQRMLEVEGDGEKVLMIFSEPKDVRGTAFLNYIHARRPDDQWLFLPALRRVKRISSKRKTGRFMGSEFTYEDLSQFQPEKYEYLYQGEAEHEGRRVFLLRAAPVDTYSGYQYLLMHVDQERYQPLRIDFHDRRGGLAKTMVMNDMKQYLGRYWRADSALMTNHKTGDSTLMLWSDYQFGISLRERDFSPDTLDRIR